jgi:hypothetical protein
MNRVWEASRQSGGALLVLLAIADFADDDGLAYPSIATLARKARLSDRQVQRVIAGLVAARELTVEPGAGRQGSHLFHVAVGASVASSATSRQPGSTPDKMSPRQNVTGDNLSPPARHRRRQGVTPVSPVGVTPASPKPSYPEPSGNITPQPPSPAHSPQQQGEKGGDISASVAARGHPPPAARSPSAGRLVDGLYRGLGVHLDDLTPTIRARELAIAEQLVQVGATPAEAEAYAREMGTFGNRLAPIDLRSFERERASWLARRRAARAGDGRYVDRTGEGVDGEPVRLSASKGSPTGESVGPRSPLERSPAQDRLSIDDEREHDQLAPTPRPVADVMADVRRRVEGSD